MTLCNMSATRKMSFMKQEDYLIDDLDHHNSGALSSVCFQTMHICSALDFVYLVFFLFLGHIQLGGIEKERGSNGCFHSSSQEDGGRFVDIAMKDSADNYPSTDKENVSQSSFASWNAREDFEVSRQIVNDCVSLGTLRDSHMYCVQVRKDSDR